MTIEERKEQERKQKEWVKTRLNCTMQAVYDSLVDAIIYDVGMYNESTGKRSFEVKEGELTVVQPITDTECVEKDYVAIKLQDKCIEVTHRSKAMFTVKPHWDENELKCKLLIDDDSENVFSYPQISQKAIGELLFKPPIYPGAL